MRGARVAGVGIALPRREVDNAEIAEGLGIDDDWIFERTGIRSRRFASGGESAASLGAAAAASCLASARTAPDDVDVVICATVTPDLRFPATACLIQSRIGVRGAAFDVNAGCAGFLFALAQADALVRAGTAESVLVVGCEVLSRITDRTETSTAILFGDGAGAVLVEQCETNRLGPFALYSDGSQPELLYVPEDDHVIRMRGREVYRAAVAGMASAVTEVLRTTRASRSDVDLVIAHQANRRIVDALADRLDLVPEQVFTNIERYGNTSAASIPIALHDALAAGRLHDGDRLILTAFGAGFCWGAAMVEWWSEPRRVAAESTAELAGV